MDIRLYIGDKQVDLSENVDILFNWEESDTSNPTVIKNGYSKTVVLDGTKNNCDIFGHFWDLERYQRYGGYTGVDYNPSYRVPFTLYYNGSIYEKGYVKLQKVTTIGKKHSFEVGLFGGLGSFLYNLDVNWETGNKKSLADFQYAIGLDGLSTKARDVFFAWQQLQVPYGTGGSISSKYQILNYAPTYAGLPSNLDTDKVLINFSGSPLTQTSGDSRTFNGYALGTLPSKLTMEEVKDYRAYLQTPVLRMRTFLDALDNPANSKGKYDEGFHCYLDPDWFDETNPYYSDTWITLNQISTTKGSFSGSSQTIISSATTPAYTTVRGNAKIIAYEMPENLQAGETNVSFKVNADVPNCNESSLFISVGDVTRREPYNPAAIAVSVYTSNDAGGENVGTTGKLQWLTNSFMLSTGVNKFTFEQGKNYFTPTTDNVETVEGTFHKTGSTYQWGNDFNVLLSVPERTKYVIIKIEYVSPRGTQNGQYKLFDSMSYNQFLETYNAPLTGLNVTNASATLGVSETSNFISGTFIPLDKLLATSFSPADLLIAYCKQFGLYIYKDVAEDKIYILTRKNFFKRANINNLEDIINTSKEIEINPVYADTNFVSLTNEGYKSTSYKDYKEAYNKEYGQKILETGYEFNADTKELLSSPLKSAIQTKELSPYFFERDDNGLNPYVFNGFSYLLYKNGDNKGETVTIEVPKKEIIESFVPFGNNAYYDLVSKPQFEDASHKGTGTEGVLLFFTGYNDVTEKGYFLSDDNSYMSFLNNNPCWLMTNVEYDANHNKIAWLITDMPKFSRWLEGNKWMIYSMDFGSPRELFTDDMVNNEEANIYHNCFKAYYEDLYDINTKVVTCYIKGDNLTAESLRNIYWFRNGFWRLNKIYDYNPATPNTTKCDFIKIQDLNSLTNETPTKERWIKITLDKYEISQSGGTIIGTVTTSDNYGWTIEGLTYSPTSPAPRELVTFSPISGDQSGNFTLSVPSNIRDFREVTIKVSSDHNQYVSGSTAFSQEGVEYSFGISPTSFTGGTLLYTGTTNITNPYYYDWTVESKPSWVTVTPSSITNGQTGYTGDTAVTIQVEKNTTEVERTGTITFKETTYNHSYTVSVWQDGYVFSVSPTTLNEFSKSGGTQTVTIANPYGYGWIVESKPDWITTARTASGNLEVTAAANIVFERTGTIVIKDTEFNHTFNVSVSQESGYVFDIDPTYFYFLPDYELEDTLTIINPNRMAWTITNIPNWITLSPTAGTGTSVSMTVAENIGFERSGLSISVNETLCDQHYPFDVVQESGYYFELLPTTGLTFASGATSKTMVVSCKGYNWQITSKPNWITASTTTGFGETNVTLTASKNIGYERTGVIKVKNTDFNLEYTLDVSQESGYYFVVSPLSFNFTSAGTGQQLTITNPNGYHWYIDGQPSWLHFSETSGNASATITVSANVNGWDTRTDDFYVYEDTISGGRKEIDVTQAEGYTLEYTPTGFVFNVTSGTGTITLTNPDHYNLQITSNKNWMTISPTATTASTAVTVSYTDNGSTDDDRTGVITITNSSRSKTHTLNVIQAGYLFRVEPTSETLTFASGGETTFIMIMDGNNLEWEVTSYPNWLTPNVTTGNSTRSVEFTAPTNAGRPERTGQIKVLEKAFNREYIVNVKQYSGYKFEVSPTTFNFAGTGETKTFTITNPYGCSWQMLSPCGWLSFNPTTGNSNATVSVTAGANGWDARNCTFYVEETTYGGGAQMTASQASGYTLSFSPSSFNFGVTSGSGTITITNPDNYNLSITDNQSWITLAPTALTSSSSVTVSVVDNHSSTSDRSGTITITNNSRSKTHTISVAQAGYQFRVEPSSLEFASGGETTFIMIYDGNGIDWEISSYPSWLTPNVTAGNTTRSVEFTAPTNAGRPQRTGQIKVKDKAFNIEYIVNVTQLSGYQFSVSPSSFSFIGAGESKTFTVTNPYGYSWQITNPLGWLSFSQTAGTSNATVTVTAAANGWDARTGKFYVEETTYGGSAEMSVSQASGYTLSYSPSSFNFNAGSGSSTLTITNPDRYNLSISSNQSWLTVSPTATTNASQNVTLSYANNSSSDRSATITITNNSRSKTHTINASQAGYLFRVEPSSLEFASGGSTEIIMIFDGNNFNWEVTSYPSWLTPNVTTGNTTRSVEFTAPTNGGRPERTGTITVKDKVFNIDYSVSVTQKSGYAFSVSPTSASFNATGGTATITITNPYGYNWNITNYLGWVSASPTTGNSSATVTLTATANTSEYGRSGSVYVEETTVGGGAEITVSQAGQTYLTPRILSITATEQDNPDPPTPTAATLIVINKMSYDTYGSWSTTLPIGASITGAIPAGDTDTYNWSSSYFPFIVTAWSGTLSPNTPNTWYINNHTRGTSITITKNQYGAYEGSGSLTVNEGDEIWLTT